MKIYFAGPLFTPYEREYISKSAQVLRENGIDPFVPHESPKVELPDDTRSRAKRCFDNDFKGISEAHAMLAIVNGTEVDDGTAAEIGIFYALMKTDPAKKGIVALHNDFRTGEAGEGKGLNSFVLGCLREVGVICKTVEEALEHLKAWKQALSDEGVLQEEEAAA
ncbi:MAG: nucleoside 2-deoxyribosyltransferase [Anaerolineae bacterium]|nr:nucleoside 2-deoxyribosyltransferase [Anaerolineae bacterium]